MIYEVVYEEFEAPIIVQVLPPQTPTSSVFFGTLL